MKKNGYTFIEIIVLVVVLGAVSIFAFVKMSYAFENKSEEYYNSTIDLVLTEAKLYGKRNEDKLKDKEDVYITVSDLINEGYLEQMDEDGLLIDPRDKNKDLNHLKIKITYHNDEVLTEIA